MFGIQAGTSDKPPDEGTLSWDLFGTPQEILLHFPETTSFNVMNIMLPAVVLGRQQ